MSVEAITWALRQKVGRSSTKHVLTLMANCASAPAHRSYTSIAYLVQVSELDRKTVIAAITKLEELGLISDTGERTGRTGQIVVYQIHIQSVDNYEQGTKKRNRTGNGTVPRTARKVAENGLEESQKWSGSGPKTGHVTEGTDQEQNRTEARVKRAGVSIELPDWLPEKSWEDWLVHRAQMKAPLTQRAAELSISVLTRLRAEGSDPVSVVEESVLRGWTGLFAKKSRQANQAQTEQALQAVPAIWWGSNDLIRVKGASMGMPYDGQENVRRYNYRVFKAAGPGPWVERELTRAARMNEFEYERVFSYFTGERPVVA